MLLLQVPQSLHHGAPSILQRFDPTGALVDTVKVTLIDRQNDYLITLDNPLTKLGASPVSQNLGRNPPPIERWSRKTNSIDISLH